MGNVLIIKNADFSAVAIDTLPPTSTIWYTNKINTVEITRNFRNYNNNLDVTSFYGVYDLNYIDVPINVIRSKFVNTGIDAETTVSKDVQYGIYRGTVGEKPILIKNFYLSDSQIETGLLEIDLEKTITLGNYEMITIGGLVTAQQFGGTIGYPVGRADNGFNIYYMYPNAT